ncbi:class I SAM-dependent methyltransferase [Neobacillus terrae]|uniref:class I SAM-dependent methyltransferase n=1 Tax=Neobacillus terrae TaxID=3034837 RepID=UPI00140A6DDA|nr:class I SAM-dependent methyltransferase [Neobacillus terrae]NHM33910.1 class I SAM-dependent methyltransferase [Neobacillus terrae]
MGRAFADWYDFFMSPLEKSKFKGIRKNLLDKANGDVLEIGAGTGVNFPLYKNAEKVIAIEPSEYMIEESKRKLEKATVPIQIIPASAEQLPFEDKSFDTVVATLVFCTIPDVDTAIEEMKRVCKPSGRILLFEHVKMDNPMLGKLQVKLTPVWKKICDGCCLDRNTIESFKRHGLIIENMESYFSGLFITAEARLEK